MAFQKSVLLLLVVALTAVFAEDFEFGERLRGDYRLSKYSVSLPASDVRKITGNKIHILVAPRSFINYVKVTDNTLQKTSKVYLQTGGERNMTLWFENRKDEAIDYTAEVYVIDI